MARCVAPLKTSSWYPYDDKFVNVPQRCRANAKPDSLFCGTHRHLESFIETIVWKENV